MHPALAAILAVGIPTAAGIVVQQQQSQKPAEQPSEHARPPLAPPPYGTDRAPTEVPPAVIPPYGLNPMQAEALRQIVIEAVSVANAPLVEQLGQLKSDMAKLSQEMRDEVAKLNGRHDAHVKAVAERFAEMEKAHRAKMDELSAQFLALAAKLDSAGPATGRAAPQGANGDKALKAMKDKLNKQKKDIAVLRSELAEVRVALAQRQSEPHRTLKPEAPHLPRLLPSGTRTFTGTGREYVLVAFSGPCGQEVNSSLPLQRPGAERVWSPQECPNCSRAFSARVVSLAPLNVEVIAK